MYVILFLLELIYEGEISRMGKILGEEGCTATPTGTSSVWKHMYIYIYIYIYIYSYIQVPSNFIKRIVTPIKTLQSLS